VTAACLGLGEDPFQNGFLDMQTIFGLIPDDGGRAFHDLVGDLFAAVGGQAVEHLAARGGLGQQRRIDLEAGEHLGPSRLFGLLPHGGPDVGIEVIRAGGGLDRIVDHTDIGTKTPGAIHDGGRRFVSPGRSDGKSDGAPGGGVYKRMGDIVAVADKGHPHPVESAGMLAHGEQIGHDLAGMVFVGQGIDHGNGAVSGQLFQLVVAKRAHDEAVGVAGEHAGGIADGLVAAELGIVLGHEHGPTAEVSHGDLEGNASPGGGLLENENTGLALQNVATKAGGLHDGGPIEDMDGLVRGEIEDGQEMLGHGGILAKFLPVLSGKFYFYSQQHPIVKSHRCRHVREIALTLP